MDQDSILTDLIAFLREERRWWMTPFALVLGLVGALLVVAEGSALAPFIYPLF